MTGVPVSSAPEQAEAPGTSSDGTAPVRTPAAGADGPQATVAVDGGELPEALVEGYARNGGDLVDPAEWSGRFGRSALPELTGPGVKLVEGLRRMELVDGRWVQTDEAGWLAMTGDDRDSMMDSLRAAADIVGVASTTTSTDQGADCVIDTYQPDTDGVSWQIQGCSYEKFPRLAVARHLAHRPDRRSAAADRSDDRHGRRHDRRLGDLRRGAPRGTRRGSVDPASLRASRHPARVRARLPTRSAGGPLAGWQTFPGEGSLLLSGPTGATWTLSDGVAVFTWSGRW